MLEIWNYNYGEFFPEGTITERRRGVNKLNYASLEASKRLVEAGIVLETDAVWYVNGAGWQLSNRDWVAGVITYFEMISAPSMAEVWRELPDLIGAGELRMARIINTHEAVLYYGWIDEDGKEQIETKVFRNTNPADALIDLLIFIKVKEHHHE